MHASEYEQKPVDVTESANKFASSQYRIATSGAQYVQPLEPNGCERRTMIPRADQRAMRIKTKSVARTSSGQLTPL
jgi:hypothetical protein